MKPEDQISVSQFAKKAGISTNYVYYLGKHGNIEIQEVAGFKVIDTSVYNPEDFKPKKK